MTNGLKQIINLFRFATFNSANFSRIVVEQRGRLLFQVNLYLMYLIVVDVLIFNRLFPGVDSMSFEMFLISFLTFSN